MTCRHIAPNWFTPGQTIDPELDLYNMSMPLNTGEILITAFSVSRALIVGLWPLVMLQPLRRGRWVRVGDFVLAWVIVAAFWFGGSFLPEARIFRWFAFIPSVLDLPLFLTVGAGLGVWWLWSRRRTPSRRSAADTGITSRQTLSTSPIEALFWERAKPRIPDLQWQYPIGRYRADFFVPSANLVIELNGLAYHSGRDKRIQDAAREREIERLGYRVITFLGPEVTRDVEGCIQEVLAAMNSAASPMAPRPMAVPSPMAPAAQSLPIKSSRWARLSVRQALILGGLAALFVLATVALGAFVGMAFANMG